MTGTGGANGLRPAVPAALLIEGAHDVYLRDVSVVWGAAEPGQFGAGLEVRGSTGVTWTRLAVSAFDGVSPAIVVDGEPVDNVDQVRV